MQIDEYKKKSCQMSRARTSERKKKLILIFFQNNNFLGAWCFAAMIYDAIKLAVVKLAHGVINETFYFFTYRVCAGGIKES
jgi:hypothetical protein